MLLDSKVNRYRPDKGIQTRLIDKMGQSKNSTVQDWITDLLVPLLVVCLAVGWLIWWMWPEQSTIEQFKAGGRFFGGRSSRIGLLGSLGRSYDRDNDNEPRMEDIITPVRLNSMSAQAPPVNIITAKPDLTGNRYSGSTTNLAEIYKSATWDNDNYVGYKYITADIFNGNKVLVNALLIKPKPNPYVLAFNNSYSNLTPQLIEQMIITGKAKAKHISNLIGYLNWNKDGKGNGNYMLTDNGSDPNYFIPGDIYVALNVRDGPMPPLPFEYYLTVHESVLDISNRPQYGEFWTDGGTGGGLDNDVVFYDNKLCIGRVTNDNIFRTVNSRYMRFGYVNATGGFVFFSETAKPTITSLEGGHNVSVTLPSGAVYTNYKFFDKDTYATYGRPNNIIPVAKIAEFIAPLLPQNAKGETLDEDSAYKGFVQKANVISTDPGVSSPANQTIDEAVEYSYSRKIQLGDTYYVKQLCISNLFTFSDPTLSTVSDIRIGIKNNRNNTIQFVGFSERLLGADGTNYLAAITKRSGPYLVIQDVKTAYGNELSGDEVIIYSKIETGKNADKEPLDVCITGYPENEKLDYKTLFTDAKPIAGLPPVEKDGKYPQSLYTDGEVSQTTQAIVPSHITTVTLAAYTGGTAPYDKLAYKSDVTSLNTPKNGDKLTVLFKNNYSNNSFQVPGPVNQSFIFHTQAPNLFFYKTVIANKFKIYFDKLGNDGNAWHAAAVSARGYTPSSADINRFKLEFNVTDIRGSINPESVCPSMDKFLANQLDSEVILDAMDYNDRINTEQAKLIGQKDNLLTLMEQEEDIARLNRVINRLLDVEKQRSAETNALNAVKFTNQMKEAMKLKEVLEQRIAQRKKNTLDLQFRVNQVVETDQLPTPTTSEPFEDMPNPINATNRVRPTIEDDLRIR